MGFEWVNHVEIVVLNWEIIGNLGKIHDSILADERVTLQIQHMAKNNASCGIPHYKTECKKGHVLLHDGPHIKRSAL